MLDVENNANYFKRYVTNQNTLEGHIGGRDRGRKVEIELISNTYYFIMTEHKSKITIQYNYIDNITVAEEIDSSSICVKY